MRFVVQHPHFEFFILLTVIVSCTALALQKPNMPDAAQPRINVANLICVARAPPLAQLCIQPAPLRLQTRRLCTPRA